ncbi:hypothetical protein SAMN06265355_102159 [Actinomadura mexicana]|uniref:Uncharacterized protein n=1 Tax=Actinomadura mexicana TaxID=134959 RepID=A0A238VP32_9ACTN|nr:hypothetical protein SAMN06265355_102159 [Actinomadura mexicana]
MNGPMGYRARPEAMGTLISNVFADRLLERGVKYARVGLMAVFVQERVGTESARMERCPAHEAIGRALGVMARAWDEAMIVHGMFRQTIRAEGHTKRRRPWLMTENGIGVRCSGASAATNADGCSRSFSRPAIVETCTPTANARPTESRSSLSRRPTARPRRPGPRLTCGREPGRRCRG